MSGLPRQWEDGHGAVMREHFKGCGAISEDKRDMCALALGHDGPHGWENKRRCDGCDFLVSDNPHDITEPLISTDDFYGHWACYASLKQALTPSEEEG